MESIDSRERTRRAAELLDGFAERTGIDGGPGQERRYLWTDALAVCGFVELHRRGLPGALSRARRLVALVHAHLGRHRTDGPRRGWLGGSSDPEGRLHPTAGGLRIGKPRPERGPREPFDERGEWDRDGQYFHYLTRWMHALAVLAAEEGDPRPLEWALELARVAVRAFAHVDAWGRPGLYWKLSIDLRRPLVAGTSPHDPLDGFVTALELAVAASGEAPLVTAGVIAPDPRARIDAPVPPLPLEGERGRLRAMLGPELTTADPLGLGGLLVDAGRLAALAVLIDEDLTPELDAVLVAIETGLASLAHEGGLDGPVEGRLAFRELGLAIGLAGLPRLVALLGRRAGPDDHRPGLLERAERLATFLPLRERLEHFWLDARRRSAPPEAPHRDIDDVTLAVSLAPDALLEVPIFASATRAPLTGPLP